MTLVRTLVAGTATAVVATSVLALVLEATTRPPPKPPPKAAAPRIVDTTPITPNPVKTETITRPKAPPLPAVPEAPLGEAPARPPLAPRSGAAPTTKSVVPESLPKAAALPDPRIAGIRPPHPPEPLEETERRRPTRDICERHNRRKVYTRNGRSWRCRR